MADGSNGKPTNLLDQLEKGPVSFVKENQGAGETLSDAPKDLLGQLELS